MTSEISPVLYVHWTETSISTWRHSSFHSPGNLLHRRHIHLPALTARLKHHQLTCICASNHLLRGHPGVAQEVMGVCFKCAGLFQDFSSIAKDLEHPVATHTDLCVVLRVEADLRIWEGLDCIRTAWSLQ